jgi:hypothetical protein
LWAEARGIARQRNELRRGWQSLESRSSIIKVVRDEFWYSFFSILRSLAPENQKPHPVSARNGETKDGAPSGNARRFKVRAIHSDGFDQEKRLGSTPLIIFRILLTFVLRVAVLRWILFGNVLGTVLALISRGRVLFPVRGVVRSAWFLLVFGFVTHIAPLNHV